MSTEMTVLMGLGVYAVGVAGRKLRGKIGPAQNGQVAPDNAVTVDGGPITDAGDVLDFPGQAYFSAEAWVKPTVADGTTRRILSKETTDAAGLQGWALWLEDGRVGFERARDGVADTITGGSVTPGRWSHVAGRFSGQTARTLGMVQPSWA